VEAHTKHAAASTGSRCVNCHMPYIQHPELGGAVRYARSDHSIPIPRPAFDSSLGITSACRNCHATMSESALDTAVRRWWGTLKPHPRAVDALVRARSVRDRGEAARLVLDADAGHPSALFSGAAWFLDTFLLADMPKLERDIVERLQRIAGSPHPDVRALALASLHYARGEQRDVREFLAGQLGGFGAADGALRRRWAVVLGYLGDERRAAGDAAGAAVAYRKALEIMPSDPRVLLNLGLAYADAGDAASAIEHYRRSLELDGRQPLAFVNLGIALESGNDLARAAVAYRRAIALDPGEPLAYFNLGNALLKSGDVAGAIPLYERVIALDPSIAPAHFSLAQALVQRRDYARALAEVRAGLEFEPGNDRARQLETQLARTLGGR
jgi:Flp pilus assembly protein TadD